MKYQETDAENDKRHQIRKSKPFDDFKCVSGFVLEYMHLVLPAIVKRLIEFWKKRSQNDIRCKLS